MDFSKMSPEEFEKMFGNYEEAIETISKENLKMI